MKELHHANIYIGESRDEIYKVLINDLELKISGSPDFFFKDQDLFGIDHARALEKWSTNKPLVGEKKAAFIIANSLNREAQNALLKVLEEPTPHTYFFIQLPNLSGVLPTFLSRVRVYDNRLGVKDDESKKMAKDFLLSNIKSRFSTIRTLSKNEDKSTIKDLINSLESVVYEDRFKEGDMDKEEFENMRSVLKAKTFSSLKGGSPKMILEWLSCVL